MEKMFDVRYNNVSIKKSTLVDFNNGAGDGI